MFVLLSLRLVHDDNYEGVKEGEVELMLLLLKLIMQYTDLVMRDGVPPQMLDSSYNPTPTPTAASTASSVAAGTPQPMTLGGAAGLAMTAADGVTVVADQHRRAKRVTASMLQVLQVLWVRVHIEKDYTTRCGWYVARLNPDGDYGFIDLPRPPGSMGGPQVPPCSFRCGMWPMRPIALDASQHTVIFDTVETAKSIETKRLEARNVRVYTTSIAAGEAKHAAAAAAAGGATAGAAMTFSYAAAASGGLPPPPQGHAGYVTPQQPQQPQQLQPHHHQQQPLTTPQYQYAMQQQQHQQQHVAYQQSIQSQLFQQLPPPPQAVMSQQLPAPPAGVSQQLPQQLYATQGGWLYPPMPK